MDCLYFVFVVVVVVTAVVEDKLVSMPFVGDWELLTNSGMRGRTYLQVNSSGIFGTRPTFCRIEWGLRGILSYLIGAMTRRQLQFGVAVGFVSVFLFVFVFPRQAIVCGMAAPTLSVRFRTLA